MTVNPQHAWKSFLMLNLYSKCIGQAVFMLVTVEQFVKLQRPWSVSNVPDKFSAMLISRKQTAWSHHTNNTGTYLSLYHINSLWNKCAGIEKVLLNPRQMFAHQEQLLSLNTQQWTVLHRFQLGYSQTSLPDRFDQTRLAKSVQVPLPLAISPGIMEKVR